MAKAKSFSPGSVVSLRPVTVSTSDRSFLQASCGWPDTHPEIETNHPCSYCYDSSA